MQDQWAATRGVSLLVGVGQLRLVVLGEKLRLFDIFHLIEGAEISGSVAVWHLPTVTAWHLPAA